VHQNAFAAEGPAGETFSATQPSHH